MSDIKTKKEIIWRAAEYDYVRKNPGWYWIVSGVAAVLVGIAFWQKNFFFGVFMILAVSVLLFFGKKRPQVFEFSLTDDKVKIGERTAYEYKNLENFAVHERPGRLDELVFKRKTTVNPYFRVSIDSKLAVRARDFLREKLPEVEHQESLLDAVSDWLGL